jgi:hypothetical protein
MATDDKLRMRTTLVDNASSPLRALERTFREKVADMVLRGIRNCQISSE